MGLRFESSSESLQRSLVLYRKLLSVIQNPGSELQVAKFVVDMLSEEFPDCRVAYAFLRTDGDFEILYSRQPGEMTSLSGVRGKLQPGPWLDKLLRRHISVIDDIYTHPDSRDVAEQFYRLSGAVARLDLPFDRNQAGQDGVISLSRGKASPWSPFTIQLLCEVVELVQLMIREACTRERLDRSESMFREFSQNMPVVFWVSEPSGQNAKEKMTFVSSAYEQIWGLSAEALMANPTEFIEAVHPEDRERVRKAVSQQIYGPYQEIYRVIRPDGSIRWIKDRGIPIRDQAGNVYRILGIAEDITALHEAKEKLLVTQAQVISNAKFAALGEMAGGIAHEINNPLAVISALAQQMRELSTRAELSPQTLHDSIETIEKMCSGIANIVKGLRTFSRQTDRDPLLTADIRDILRDTLALCEAKVQQATTSLTIEFPKEALFLKCRPSEISQVILNLVSNALDAVADAKEKSIALRLKVNRNLIEMSVEDSGPGIKPELQEQIFHPFFTTKEVGKGTGLGLSISKGIAEAHGGKLFLDCSSPHTKFVLQLPLEKK